MNALRERIRMSLAITRKDIVDALTNRMFLVGFLLPPILSVMFTLIFINQYRNAGIKLAVYDPGHSAFVETLQAQPGIDVIEVASEDQIQQTLAKDAVGGLVVPPGFDEALASDDTPQITLYMSRAESSGTRENLSQLIQEALRKQAGQTLPAEITVNEVGDASSMFSSGSLSLQHFFMITLVSLAIVSIGVNTVPNMLIEEKERHTLDVILVSPASSAEVIIGKAVTGLLFTALDVAILMGMNRGWAGQWPLTIALLVLGILLMVLSGLLLGTVFNRQVTMNMWGSIIVMLLLAPTWFVGRGPEAIRILSHGLPTFYLVHGLQQTITGEATLATIGPDFLALGLGALVMFAIVVWAQSRQEIVA